MSIYHFSVKIISRGQGKSSVAAAAYRSGTKLIDERQGKTFDYHKSEVAYSNIIIPPNAPKEYKNREKLWNAVEKIEKQSNSATAREWEIAIPNELDLEQAISLVENFTQSLANEGICADCNIHWKNGNHHAHILGTTRPLKPDGTWGEKERKSYALDKQGKKIPIIDPETGQQKIGARGRKMWKRELVASNDWNKREKLLEWRERWANMVNLTLEQAKIAQKVDHRSNITRGITDTPTIHEGYAARAIEKRGNIADRCEINRKIKQENAERQRIEQEIRQKTAEIAALEHLEEEEREHDERLARLLKRRENAKTLGRTTNRERATESQERTTRSQNTANRAANSDNQTTREYNNRAERFNQVLKRREREAAEARREREEAKRRERELIEKERRARAKIEAERQKIAEQRGRNNSFISPEQGFSR